MRYSIRVILFSFLLIAEVNAQLPSESAIEDEKRVTDFFLKEKIDAPVLSTSERMIRAALYLLDTPYVGATLEINANTEEQLVINLRELDCSTFMENCLALSRVAGMQDPDFELFRRELRFIRYRHGIIAGYASRLHYTSDWLNDNIRKNVIDDVTKALGGKHFPVNVDYMSTHPEKYPALRNNPEQVNIIREVETAINARNSYYYIPTPEIVEKQALIKSGDIVCFTTSIPGLDISHVGIAYRLKNQLTFIHASLKAKKVIINPDSLSDYCLQNGAGGIIVLRPKNNIGNL
ncbi:MAG: DUF1460 domain-containing protein [Dysgonamonadaceae bacterium]|jgi:hypothetical protein|nr:DUF1460 domain-containing protein [Dysgonamonadaceae bacterium]